MSYSCAACSFECNPYCQNPAMSSYPVKSNCCLSSSCVHKIEPLMPVASTARPVPKKHSSKFVARKQPPLRPSMCKNRPSIATNRPSIATNRPSMATKRSTICQKPVDPCPSFINKPSLNENSHPLDCACPQCEKCLGMQDLACPSKDNLLSQNSACESEMSNPRSERNMKNYFHDNPQIEEIKVRKSASSASLMDCVGPNSEVWILQCPKNFDPKTIMNTELGNLQKDKSCKIDLTTKCFNNKISLACLTPEKAAEYEAVCDKVKMLRPVGKITVVQKANLPRKSSTVKLPAPIKIEPKSDVDDCTEDEDVKSCPSQNPITSKKLKTTINDQKFTIETTVTVENCGGDNRKKNRKSKNSGSCGECLPLVPPEPIVPKKKQKKNRDDDEDSSWLNC